MDGIIGPLEARIRALELALFGPAKDDSGHNEPAQTVDLRRMPAAPGLPMAPELPDANEGFMPPDPNANPDGSEDPTLNEDGSTRRRRKSASEDA